MNLFNYFYKDEIFHLIFQKFFILLCINFLTSVILFTLLLSNSLNVSFYFGYITPKSNFLRCMFVQRSLKYFEAPFVTPLHKMLRIFMNKRKCVVRSNRIPLLVFIHIYLLFFCNHNYIWNLTFH